MNNLAVLIKAVEKEPDRASDLVRAAYWLGASEGIRLAKEKPQDARRFSLDMAESFAGKTKLGFIGR